MKAPVKIEDLRNSACAKLNPHLFSEVEPSKTERNKFLAKQKKKGSKYKAWITLNISYWCKERSLEMKKELKFNQYRKFSFDWAIPALKIAVEYEGLMSEKSGHTSAVGFSTNTEKYNLAAADGWTVLRYTSINHNYKNVIADLNKLFKT